jgi:hypothetical protein
VVEEDPQKRIAELERELAQQRRIAELERQLAEAKAAAGDHGAADEQANRYAQSLLEDLRGGEPSGPEAAQMHEALMRAAGDAGMSEQQLDQALQRAYVTVKSSRVVYPGMGSGGAALGRQAAFRARRSRRGMSGGSVFGALAGLFGICVGGAAALTAVFPATALWASAIVCRSPYRLDYSTSHYSYRPGQSGTSVSFQCVSGDAWYGVNEFALMGLQSLLIGLVACGLVTAGWLISRQFRRA